MLQAVFTGITAYISTSIDYLVILMIIFGTTSRKNKWSIYGGDLLGTTVLVITSLFIANILKLVPEDWILGLLGLIPIFLGIRLLISNENDDESTIKKRLQSKKNIFFNVAIITIVTCGADNIGIYVPLFAQMDLANSMVVIITFFIMLSLFCLMGLLLSRIPLVANILEKWGSYITAIVYIGLGGYILWESGTLMHFLS
ncbi:cadmium binding protein [Liquorilactobacillus aquaticus DSM 21051]|uniref:Cadmium binding protein n=1 Tax=Liquorilactobacillus aquaticus DSM 21051 TaxID=1423725 RepID=A0A0R2D8Y5_9LACO|nr:cadmium resistance transporter [Liquorilactobacillus aquaticus]KRM97078.1 cadmium binding protein [Liquorilactobacillus aquaticus DSM 21051]